MSFQQTAVKLAKMLNISPDYTFQGKVYHIKDATIKQRAEFATWVEQRAFEALDRIVLNDETGSRAAALREMRSDLIAEIAAGKYEWGGKPVLEAVETRVGQIQLLYILLKADNPEVVYPIAEAMFNERQADVARRIEEAFNDPKVLSELGDLADTLNLSDGLQTVQ